MLHNYKVTTQNAYQYKYNGKELQETGMYDYGARFLMPDIGRWFSPDKSPFSQDFFCHQVMPKVGAYNQSQNKGLQDIIQAGHFMENIHFPGHIFFMAIMEDSLTEQI